MSCLFIDIDLDTSTIVTDMKCDNIIYIVTLEAFIPVSTLRVYDALVVFL